MLQYIFQELSEHQFFFFCARAHSGSIGLCLLVFFFFFWKTWTIGAHPLMYFHAAQSF